MRNCAALFCLKGVSVWRQRGEPKLPGRTPITKLNSAMPPTSTNEDNSPVPGENDLAQIRPLIPDIAPRGPLLFVVEGIHDIHYLRRISRMLHATNGELPDLASWEAARRLVFIPFGGGDVFEWTDRLAPVGLPELHLLCGAPHKRCYVAQAVMWPPHALLAICTGSRRCGDHITKRPIAF